MVDKRYMARIRSDILLLSDSTIKAISLVDTTNRKKKGSKKEVAMPSIISDLAF